MDSLLLMRDQQPKGKECIGEREGGVTRGMGREEQPRNRDPTFNCNYYRQQIPLLPKLVLSVRRILRERESRDKGLQEKPGKGQEVIALQGKELCSIHLYTSLHLQLPLPSIGPSTP